MLSIVSIVTLVLMVPNYVGAEQPWVMRRQVLDDHSSLAIQYHEHNESQIPRVVRLVELGKKRFLALADTNFALTIHVLIASTQREFAELTSGMVPDWGAAVAIPREQLMIVALNAPEKSLEEAIPHEVSHILLGAISRHEHVPRWFDEGLAMYLAGEWTIYNAIRLGRGALGGGLIPLHSIDNVLTFRRDQAWLAYAESFAALTWLEEAIGKEGLGRLIRKMNSITFEEALIVNESIRTSEFEERWLARARRRYALVGLADDVWIWSIVIPALFFLALAVRKWRNNRIYKRWRMEDDDDDEPDEPLDERILDTY